MENDLIRRSDVLKKTVWLETDVPTRAATLRTEIVLADDVRSIPAVDAVEVVRCSDCVHFEPFRRHDGFCKIDGMLRENDFFCKYGQRREDGDGDV